MLQFKCPEKRRQALRGRNLPRDIRAEVRQGAVALSDDYRPGPLFSCH